jgi:hypothetical protein
MDSFGNSALHLLLETNYGGFHPAASRSVPGIDRVTGFLYAHRKIHKGRRVVSQTSAAGEDDANCGLPTSARSDKRAAGMYATLCDGRMRQNQTTTDITLFFSVRPLPDTPPDKHIPPDKRSKINQATTNEGEGRKLEQVIRSVA